MSTSARRSRVLLIGAFGGVVVVALLAIAWAVHREDLRIERDRVGRGSTVIATPCGPIEYAAVGSGRAVLVVHGAGGGFDQALGIAEQMAQHGYRAIAMSRFGYLRTPLPADASPAAQADAHACLLDALGVERSAIVGVSAGAPSSMQFALRHPRRTTALVLLVPLAYVPRDAPFQPSPVAMMMYEKALKSDFLYWAAMKLTPSLVVRTVLATPPDVLVDAEPREQARVRDLMRQILPLSARQAGLLNDGAIGNSIGRYELERIAAPTLAISLEDDLYETYRSARYTAEHVPGARFIGFARGGHVFVGHHDEILTQVADFLGAKR